MPPSQPQPRPHRVPTGTSKSAARRPSVPLHRPANGVPPTPRLTPQPPRKLMPRLLNAPSMVDSARSSPPSHSKQPQPSLLHQKSHSPHPPPPALQLVHSAPLPPLVLPSPPSPWLSEHFSAFTLGEVQEHFFLMFHNLYFFLSFSFKFIINFSFKYKFATMARFKNSS